MADYSATPLFRKLGIKPGHCVAFLNAPKGFSRTLGALPTGCRVMNFDESETTAIDVVLYFGESQEMVSAAFAELKGKLAMNGGLWLCWPKKASGVETDL